jgi:hypothetical protein
MVNYLSFHYLFSFIHSLSYLHSRYGIRGIPIEGSLVV